MIECPRQRTGTVRRRANDMPRDSAFKSSIRPRAFCWKPSVIARLLTTIYVPREQQVRPGFRTARSRTPSRPVSYEHAITGRYLPPLPRTSSAGSRPCGGLRRPAWRGTWVGLGGRLWALWQCPLVNPRRAEEVTLQVTARSGDGCHATFAERAPSPPRRPSTTRCGLPGWPWVGALGDWRPASSTGGSYRLVW
jgi:hypothetical protein